MLDMNNSYGMAFECSSSNAAFELMQQKMQKDGRICILVDGNIEPLILTPTFHEKELNIIGSSDWLDYPTHAKLFFDYVQKRATNLEQLFLTIKQLPIIWRMHLSTWLMEPFPL